MSHLGNFDSRHFLDQVKRSTKPVLIVCRWIKGLEGMQRDLPNGKNEWRVGFQLFEVLKEYAVQQDKRAWTEASAGVYARLEGIRVITEELPPDDFIKELTQQLMRHPDTKVER
jgi:hypothetical protein